MAFNVASSNRWLERTPAAARSASTTLLQAGRTSHPVQERLDEMARLNPFTVNAAPCRTAPQWLYIGKYWQRRAALMRKKLSAIGNSLGIVIEKPILELLQITRETELEMTTDGARLIISPLRKGRRLRVRAATDEVMADHASTFRKLAR
jgi:antitoxin component of MazEF toxin-antitoxin module